MKDSLFVAFGIISFFIAVGSLVYSLYIYHTRRNDKKVLSVFNKYTLGIFAAVVCLFIPVCYGTLNDLNIFNFFKSLLLIINHALKVFILDGSFSIITNALKKSPDLLREIYSMYASSLYVLAPFLTFGTVLSLFVNLGAELRFFAHKKRPFYIMSQLNERSVTMADSILKKEHSLKNRPVIVFTGVSEKKRDECYELYQRAVSLHAICLKEDVTALNLKKKKDKIELFLMSDTEEENVEQAITLTQNYKNQKNVSIYVYALSSISGHIIDSLDKGNNTLDDSFEKAVITDPEKIALGDGLIKEDINIDGGFYLRRINTVDIMVLDVLQKYSLKTLVCKPNEGCQKEKNDDKVISVLIVGLGETGMEFLKKTVWFYQFYGYTVEINVLDISNSVEKRVRLECPELIIKNPSSADGDAKYSIRLFAGTDCFSSDLSALFDGTDTLVTERLKKTHIAFVTLGDDDKNIDVAISLRRLFDRLHNVDAGEININKSKPHICAVVYDERKANSLSVNGSDELKNYKNQPYDISFIGRLSEQYSYDIIDRIKRIERDAFRYHIDWVRKSIQLRKIYDSDEKFRKEVNEKAADENGNIKWNDDFLYFETANSKLKLKNSKLLSMARSYINYEYYRQSSIAKSVHKNNIEGLFVVAEDHTDSDVCTCDYCKERRITEHMRWNAYMRTQGYIYGEKRNDRAGVHPDLCSWNNLTYLEKFKD